MYTINPLKGHKPGSDPGKEEIYVRRRFNVSYFNENKPRTGRWISQKLFWISILNKKIIYNYHFYSNITSCSPNSFYKLRLNLLKFK